MQEIVTSKYYRPCFKYEWSTKRFLKDVATAVGTLTAFAEPAQSIKYPHVSASSALMGDWKRLGRDMSNVLSRQNERPEFRRVIVGYGKVRRTRGAR